MSTRAATKALIYTTKVADKLARDLCIEVLVEKADNSIARATGPDLRFREMYVVPENRAYFAHWVHVHFMFNITERDRVVPAIRQAVEELAELGIMFDRGSGAHGIDWELDWSFHLDLPKTATNGSAGSLFDHLVNELLPNPNTEPHMSQKTTGLTFGEALELLKAGRRIAREGWNGKNMFLFLLPGGRVPKTAIHDPGLRKVIDAEVEGDTFEALPAIRMWTADKKVLTGWLASQTDMLTADWCVLE